MRLPCEDGLLGALESEGDIDAELADLLRTARHPLRRNGGHVRMGENRGELTAQRSEERSDGWPWAHPARPTAIRSVGSRSGPSSRCRARRLEPTARPSPVQAALSIQRPDAGYDEPLDRSPDRHLQIQNGVSPSRASSPCPAGIRETTAWIRARRTGVSSVETSQRDLARPIPTASRRLAPQAVVSARPSSPTASPRPGEEGEVCLVGDCVVLLPLLPSGRGEAGRRGPG